MRATKASATKAKPNHENQVSRESDSQTKRNQMKAMHIKNLFLTAMIRSTSSASVSSWAYRNLLLSSILLSDCIALCIAVKQSETIIRNKQNYCLSAHDNVRVIALRQSQTQIHTDTILYHLCALRWKIRASKNLVFPGHPRPSACHCWGPKKEMPLLKIMPI